MISENFVQMFEKSFKDHWVSPAITNYDLGNSFSYAELAQDVKKIHLSLEYLGINAGDKVALVGKDSAEWCVVWLGIATYGAVVVPILPTFHPDDINHIIEHSDSKCLFVGTEHQGCIALDKLSHVETTIDIKTLRPIPSLTRSETGRALDPVNLFHDRYPNGFKKEDVQFPKVSNNELMVINYTSGTTGYSKGVLLTANNLAANMIFANRQSIFKPGSRLLCFLPNAHAYSCAFNFLAPIALGCHVYILGHKPAGTILKKAFKDVRPNVVISVSLILEKVYKSVIQPKTEEFMTKSLLAVPGLRKVVYKKVGESLMDFMGNELECFIIGGAALNPEVDDFLKKTPFPYTVGYGMTECAPIISFSLPKHFKVHSCGKRLDKDICEIRIFEPEEKDGQQVGEVQVLGEVVCKGYYKNAADTDQLFTADGWMRTGDLGYIDDQGHLFLRGRSKAMLLTANGENVYPEQIEAKISMLPYMEEAILVQRERNRFVAIVTVDREAIARDGKNLDEVLQQNRQTLNKSLAHYEHVAAFELLEGDFEKTPKQSIKRYLYK